MVAKLRYVVATLVAYFWYTTAQMIRSSVQDLLLKSALQTACLTLIVRWMESCGSRLQFIRRFP